ncbi:NAD-dependent epimerase/dehydratase family protein [Halochromatium glycolicum]|uniref:Epimerase n=1 Tax=Halochromatium glycolicum TaxID=85075 RepID=A0AAJ0U0J8_9GAMM|nr:NAD-dependent epimerase/dehydratase family protein [Halochromatium glycolicum]MBK1703169.1 epimerase [Halochromatium glycolicum]
MNNACILVTGGAGMIGSNLIKRLVSMGHSVKAVDNLWRGQRENLLDEHGEYIINMERDFHELDLTVPGALDMITEGIDYVYHLADVVAGVDYVFSNEGSVFRQNLLINTNTIASLRDRPLKGYIYVGTACSFPADKQTGVDAPPLREEDQYPAWPESAYGWSKLMGEYEALLMERETGIPVSVLSLHNVYGTPCDFDAERSQVIPSLARKAARYPAEPFVVWGSGAQGRAFVHVDDVVTALVLAMEKGLGKGLVQIGPDVCTSIKDIAEALVEVSGKDISIEFDTSKPEGDRGRCADFSRAREVLGWAPEVDLKTGMSSLYQWVAERC